MLLHLDGSWLMAGPSPVHEPCIGHNNNNNNNNQKQLSLGESATALRVQGETSCHPPPAFAPPLVPIPPPPPGQ